MDDDSYYLEMAPWKAAWLYRSHPVQWYIVAVAFALSFVVMGLGVATIFIARGTTTKSSGEASDREETDRKILKITRAHYIIATIFVFSSIYILLMDSFIIFGLLKEDIAEHPEIKDEILPELADSMGYLAAILWLGLIIIPLMQLLAVTWAFSRFSKKRDSNSLADFIPEARFASTHIGQIWSMITFCIMMFWSPDDPSMWRLGFLELAIGSSSIWLQLSFAFNYRSDRLQDIHVAPTRRVRDILRMYWQTSRAIRKKKPTETEATLEASEQAAVPLLNEKAEDEFPASSPRL